MPRALVPIYAVIFLDVLGLTILIPLLPALAERTHASVTWMGVALSLTALCAALSSPLWGALSDRIGRKPVLQLSQTFSCAGYIVLALAGSLPALLFARAIEGFGGGNIGVAQSLIADVTKPDQRERAYAYAGAAFGIGFVVGPVLAGQLLRLGVAAPFWAAAALQAIDFVLTAVFVPTTGARTIRARETHVLRTVMKSAALRSVLARQVLYIVSFTYFFTIFSLYLARELHVPPETSSLLLGLAGGIGAAAQIFAAAPLERRFGARVLTQGAFALAFVAYASLALVHGHVVAFLGTLVMWAASGAILQPTLAQQIAAAAPAARRGAVLGLSDAANNGAMILAPLAAALVLDRAPAAIGLVPAAGVAIAFVIGIFTKPVTVTETPPI